MHLFASGCERPTCRAGHRAGIILPAPEFLAAVQELGGIPPELLAESQFLDAMLPTLRGDCILV